MFAGGQGQIWNKNAKFKKNAEATANKLTMLLRLAIKRLWSKRQAQHIGALVVVPLANWMAVRLLPFTKP